MDTKFTIKNFRIFDEDGVSFNIRPLTVVTGCNSSGKSTFMKAILLLNTFLKKVKEGIDQEPKNEEGQIISNLGLDKFAIDFNQYPYNLLGQFRNTIHKGSKNNEVTFSYSSYSQMLSEELTVDLVFYSKEDDEIGKAFLKEIAIKNAKGVLLYSSDQEKTTCNFNVIRKACIEFITVGSIAREINETNNQDIISGAEPMGFEGLPKAEQDEYSKLIDEYSQERINDIAQCVSTNYNLYKYLPDTLSQSKILNVLSWSKRHNSYFKIPLFDKLKAIKDKDGQIKFLADLHMSSDILDDFRLSEFDDFSQYFRNQEKRCLNLMVYRYRRRTEPVLIASSTKFMNGLMFSGLHQSDSDSDVNFSYLYQNTMDCNYRLVHPDYNKEISHFEDNGFYRTIDGSFYGTESTHYMYKLASAFIADAIREILCPEQLMNVRYVSSQRASIKRLYQLGEESELTGSLNRYFENRLQFEEHYKKNEDSSHRINYNINDFLNKWINKFGIGEKVRFERDTEGTGEKIYIEKGPNSEDILLADEGFGISQLFSILLEIESDILSFNKPFTLDNNEINVTLNDLICVEEPEIHLHPSYQSLLAEMFADAYKNYGIHFIIETHSEYLIRRLQTLVAQKLVSSEEISLLYVYGQKNIRPKGTTLIDNIDILPNGILSKPFGSGFFDEADNLALQLLGI